MAGYAKLTLIGRVGKDPETREVNGKNVAKFSVAVSSGPKDKEVTTWFSVEAWEKQADVVSKYVKRGNEIYIEGTPKIDSWEKDGKTNFTFAVRCSLIQLIGGRNAESSATDNGQAQGVGSAEATGGDDLPF